MLNVCSNIDEHVSEKNFLYLFIYRILRLKTVQAEHKSHSLCSAVNFFGRLC